MTTRNADIPEHEVAEGSEVGRLIDRHDWSSTALGPVETWPQSLKIACRIMLDSRYAMWLGWGPDLTFLYNDAYARMSLGPKHPWALGRSAREVWAEIWDDIGPRAESVVRTGKATWDERLLLFLERLGYPEETYHTFSYSPVPDDRGGIGGMLCVVTEETERVIGERRLKTLRELAATASAAVTSTREACETAARTLSGHLHDVAFALIYLINPDGSSTRLAGSAGILAGSSAAPMTIDLQQPGCWPLDRVLATGRPEVLHGIGDLLRDCYEGIWPETPHTALVLPLAKSGHERLAGFLVAGISPRRPFDDEYRGFLDLLAGQIASAVANAQAYEEEKKRAESLAELDRAKTAFFSNVSHEFRTPLTLMLGPVEDMLAAPAMPNRTNLEVVHRNGLRLQKLVNTLLDFSRIEAGRLRASYQPTDLATLTAELASNFESACERAGIALTVDCPALPDPVHVDREMWEKIVLNLISNAFKFTLDGEIAVQLRQNGNHVELRVRDTGTGIPADEMSRLFERFHRVEGARGRTQEGSGIGLALVRELVRLHGGDVQVESELEKGTTFIVTIPRGTAHLPADRIRTSPRSASATGTATSYVEEALRWLPSSSTDEEVLASAVDGVNVSRQEASRARIVLADDNADMRDYIRRLLTPVYEVIAVADGEAALQAVRVNLPDLVLSDAMMPKLDGFGLLQALRAAPETEALPVILLSARAGEEARVEGLEAGADDYLTKPFSARELLARVGSTLQIARLRQDALRRERELLAAVQQERNRLQGSEQRWRIMAEALPNLVWTDLPNGECDWLSSQWRKYTGIPEEELLGVRWLDRVIHPEDRARTLACWQAACADRGNYDLEYRIRRHDGVYRWFKTRGVPIRDDEGNIVYWFGTCTDIEDQKDAEAALREADQRKDEFLATLAHELRNPLAPIRNSLQILKMPRVDAVTAERTRDMIERQVQHLVRLVDDLLDVSRVMRGKITLHPERLELATVLARAVETVQPLIESQGQELRISCASESLPLEADPVRLAQVVGNLLTNAAKYTERGGVIWVTTGRENRHAVLRVRDNGIGIAREMLPKIFDLFVQVDHAATRSQGGLGIGLTLVKNLVEMHHGTVEAGSEGLGKGSEFIVRLPLAKGQESDPLAELHPVEPAAPLSARCRVMVVDDNVDACDSLAMLLRLQGHEVHVANTGVAALKLVEQHRPQLMFLDLGMPGMDGYEVARKLRQHLSRAELVLVALTGWGAPEDRRRTADAGFDHHLVKPIEPSAMEELLARLQC